VARKQARRSLEGRALGTIDTAALTELLGPERFFPEKARKSLRPGVAAGLAWTEAGGDVLYVEATTTPREEKLTLTGQLGDVMQESVKAARSWLWSASHALGIDPARITDTGVHVHVPAGAVPKDGPSAGVTMATALASLYLGRAVRSDLAMTGEITLSGLVLPVGGIKEKVLAAHRAGMKVIVLPRENAHDLDKLPEHVRNDLRFVLAERIEDVLAEAFLAE
jgi:ATP-dependent Lon protease